MLVGRGPQRAAIDRALAEAVGGVSTALAFTGPPGIGKTALLDYAAERAEGMRVLRARGIDSEAQIPFASLLELLRPELPMLEQLAAPQAAALEQAFALRPGRAQDRFAVGAATLGLLAACAEREPLLLVLDDVQAFDEPSAEALRFALRRLDADPIAAILAARSGHSSLLDGTEFEAVELEGLSDAEARLLRSDLPEAAVQRLTVATGGNPLALLELAPDPDELALAPDGAPVLVSARLTAAYLRRAAALDENARGALLLAATSDSGDLQLLGRAAQLVDIDIESLQAAEAAGLVTLVTGRVEFPHPLVRSAVYSDATLGARRATHRALATVLSDRELPRRAWHLAAAAVGTDEGASAALEGAAEQSLRRGGYTSASAAFERAARLTDDPRRRASLLVEAAEAAWNGGAAEQALELLAESRAMGPLDPPIAIAADCLAGRIGINRGPLMDGHAILLAAAERAVDELEAADAAIAMLADAAIACFAACRTDELTAVARRAEAILPGTASPTARIRTLSMIGAERIMSGDAAAGARSLHEAVAIADTTPGVLDDATLLPWLVLDPLFLREAEAGRRRLDAVLSATRERTAIGVLPLVLNLCARDQTMSERWRLGEATYREAIALARESDQRTQLANALAGLAWLQARQGHEQDCRANAAEALSLAQEVGAQLLALWSLTALGELELALGHPELALEQFERQRSLAAEHMISDVDLWPAPEMVEACLRLGRDEEAHTLAATYQEAASAKGQPWALARALRCGGLIAPADGLAARFEGALVLHEQTPDVFELARTRLAYGERLRRNRNRVLAREQLRAAASIFGALDARPWLERALAELEATGETLRRGEPNTVEELTPQELQIAVMLASGRTTRETAAALFLSPKTIEYHLRHVYLKLDIHSREELAQVDGLIQEVATEKTGGKRVAAVPQVAPASPEANTSPEVAPK
jgi:DNA-binding CsgD family transcriptional regulator